MSRGQGEDIASSFGGFFRGRLDSLCRSVSKRPIQRETRGNPFPVSHEKSPKQETIDRASLLALGGRIAASVSLHRMQALVFTEKTLFQR